jgi:glycosyltransferase involved in cell wall biosynthesis
MIKKADNIDITVLIPTFNHADILRETLEAMCLVDRDDLSVEFIVIDNKSTDNTKAVVEPFINRLPLRYRYEPRPGKSFALNGAVDNEPIGEIVVLTDDDVSPQKNWMLEINESFKQWPDHHVFGGKVITKWPDDLDPDWWAVVSRSGKWTLGDHDYGDKAKPYRTGIRPFGPNTWVHRSVFTKHRFDEQIGPKGSVTKIMGEDGAFINTLIQDGYEPVYYPDAFVYHRIDKHKFTPKGLRQRVWSQGAGGPHYNGVCRPGLLIKHPILWVFLRIAALCFAVGRYLFAMFHWSGAKRLGNSLPALGDVAYNFECLRRCKILRKRAIEL